MNLNKKWGPIILVNPKKPKIKVTLIEAILAKKFVQANEIIKEKFDDILEAKLIEVKKMLVIEDSPETLEEAGRFRIVRARIRNGKIQRRKKVSTNKNYTFRKRGAGPAKLVRISAAEHRHRKLGARRGKVKRRAKRARIRQKQRRSLQKRKSLGLR